MLAQIPIDLHPTLWQERILCGHIDKERYLIFTPDHDFEATDFAGLRLRVMRKGRRLPVGVPDDEAYIFDDPDVGGYFFQMRIPKTFFRKEAYRAKEKGPRWVLKKGA